MQVAAQGVVVAADGEPAEAGARHEVLDVVGRAAGADGDQLVHGHHDVARGARGELDGPGQQALLVAEHALGLRVLDDRLHLLRRERGRDLVLRLDAREADGVVRDPVERGDHRAHGAAEQHQRRREPEGGGLRSGDGEVLGHHLAEHDVQVDDDRQREDQRDRVQQRRRDPQGLERDLEQVREGGLGDDAQAGGAHGDPELRAREHEGDVLHGPQGGAGTAVARLGTGLDGAAARRDDGELGADEERVAGEQQHADQQGGPGAHRPASPRSASAGSAASTRSRSTRRASIASTRSSTPSVSISSPTSGTLPSSAMTRPPSVS